MKTICLLLIAFILTSASFAQSTNDVGKIALSIVMPENIDGLDISQLSKLETKISQIVTASGLSALGYNHNFVIYPKFAIYESNVVEGGMQNITVVNAEFSLFIKQVDNNIIFSTVVKSLKGSGSSKQLAINNAISKIPVSDPDFKTFIDSGKTKIIQYYEATCEDIILKSEGLVKMQQYEQALGLLMTVPEEVPTCYAKVQDKAIAAYKAYQVQRCSTLLQRAKTTLAGHDYYGGLNILAEIDPSTVCFQEAQQLAKSAEVKITAEEKKEWDFKMKQYNDAVSLTKLRISAIKDIAVAYYKSQPTSVHYNYIIR